MSIFDFFTREAGQERRRALEGLLTQFIPPEMRPQLGLLAEANPVVSMERAGQDAQTLFAPDQTIMDRIASLGRMSSNIAGTVAPAVVAGRAGVPVVNAVQDVLTGYSPMVQPFLVDDFGGVGLPRAARSVDDIENVLRAKYPDVKISVSGSPERGFTLNKIDVPKGKREGGIGTAVMNDLVSLADQQGAVLKLSPSSDFGGSVPRLKDFYARFGFVQNKGKNADLAISESMYRPPSIQPLPQSTDAAAERGAQIMDMLRSGRAADVTDAMLDMGDPVLNARLNEYLYRNYDLPMDAASRMGRAEERGADLTRPLFRGDANPDLLQFNTGRYAREGIGVTSSTSPNVAATYMAGDQPAMYPLLSMPSRQLSIDVGGRSWTGIAPDAPANNTTLANVLPPQSFLDEENLFDFLSGRTVDWGDGTETALAVANTNDVSRAAQAQGFDEVLFRNIVDRGGAGRFHTGAANDPQTTVMTSDPANIRSRFARFDPRLSHLRNLNAALTAGVPLGLLAMQPEEEQY